MALGDYPEVTSCSTPSSAAGSSMPIFGKAAGIDRRPHSRACGIIPHDHGILCHSNCQTCGGRENPPPPPSTGDPLGVIEAWLENQHCTMWAHHNISPEGDRRKAAEWFYSQLQSFNSFIGGAS